MVWFLRTWIIASEGNEGGKRKGKAHRLLPLPNGRVRQLEDGACIYES